MPGAGKIGMLDCVMFCISEKDLIDLTIFGLKGDSKIGITKDLATILQYEKSRKLAKATYKKYDKMVEFSDDG
ncbi:hypothetical protein NFD60_13205 (plasmid) [Staphylococcus epidermidis]|nr:hypothetical protein NFD60_13205 [Staphylococcus epidermidis]